MPRRVPHRQLIDPSFSDKLLAVDGYYETMRRPSICPFDLHDYLHPLTKDYLHAEIAMHSPSMCSWRSWLSQPPVSSETLLLIEH